MKLYTTCYFGNLHTERDPEDALLHICTDQLIEYTGAMILKDTMDDSAK